MERLLRSEEANHSDGLSWWLWTPSHCHSNLFFQQGPGLSKRTSHPSQETYTPDGWGESAVLAQACRESCHVTECDSAWDHTCLLSKQALGKWKGGTHNWNCQRPRLAQRMTQAPGAVWPGRARLAPTPATAQTHAEPGGVQRQQTHAEGARLWPTLFQPLPRLMLGTGLVSSATLADSPETERTTSILSPRKGVNCCSESPWA